VGPGAPAHLRFRMRRGMKELDVVLERYFATRYPLAPPAERDAFARLLEQEDPVIWDWMMQRTAPPPELDDVVQRLRRGA